MRAYRREVEVMLAVGHKVTRDELFERIVTLPASRFWVSEQRATVVVGTMCREARERGCTPRYWNALRSMHPSKRRMYEEIYRRYLLFKEDHHAKSIYWCVSSVVRQRAPEFYITPDSAKVIFYRIKNRYHEELKRRLRR